MEALAFLLSSSTSFQAQLALELTYSPPSGTVQEWIEGLQPSDSPYGDSDQNTDTGDELFPAANGRRRSRMSLPGWKKNHENGPSRIGSVLSLNSVGSAKHKKNAMNMQNNNAMMEMNRSGGIGPNQLGVVAGPFGQMLQARDTGHGQMSRRGSMYSVASAGSGTGML